MRRVEQHPTYGPIVAMACKCTIWPIATLMPCPRCGECRVQPRPIPRWEDLPEREW